MPTEYTITLQSTYDWNQSSLYFTGGGVGRGGSPGGAGNGGSPAGSGNGGSPGGSGNGGITSSIFLFGTCKGILTFNIRC